MSFAIGENVGPYRILEQLGQGGMASVYKAYHAALDRYVAIKVLHPAFKEEPNFISRFQREAKVVARLEHPHIVPIYDYAEHNGQPYLVMKYIEGETLKARLNQRALTKEEAVEIAEAVGGALAYAHDQGVLHRDIKPSNVLLSHDGSIYLADFGLARIAQAGASTLSKDVMMGTPQYISPEQAQGKTQLDEGTDIYSMGVVLYELVVGRVPFNADTPFSIIHDHIYSPLPVPSEVNPRVPKNVERILLKALSKVREDRFESVEALVQAFRVAVLGGEDDDIPGMEPAETKVVKGKVPGKAERKKESRPSLPDTAVQPTKRKRWPWVLGGIGLTTFCILAFLIIVGNQNGDSEEPPREPAPIEEVIDKPPPDSVLDDLPSLEDVRDPQAHLERAKRLEENDRPILAAQSYFRAGELFLDEKRYPEALESFLRSIEVGGLEIERPVRAEESFTEALFMSASELPVYEQVERLKRLVPEWPDLPIFISRTEIYHGDLNAAREMISEFLDTHPENPMALSVLAEVHLKAGEVGQAAPLVTLGLENARELPPWLRDHLNWLHTQVEK
jgi:tRNA A-37 threonylcarbamoyl transferase component Bud32